MSHGSTSSYNNLGPRTIFAGDIELSNASPLLRNLTKRNVYYVDALNGVDSGRTGRTWAKAFLTMAEAFDHVSSGDVIVFSGKVREQLTTPSGVFDVTVLGAGNRPRHADTSPVGSNLATGQWTTPASPTAATPLVKVIHQGWRFENILFAGPTDVHTLNASIQLDRTAEGADEHDASHMSVVGCRFASGHKHINDTGGCYGVLLQGNRFNSAADHAIVGVGNIGVGQSAWEIANNRFDENVNGVLIAGFACHIYGNTFSDGGTPATTTVLNTNNGGGANNCVHNNHFQTTTANFNTPDVVGCATDYWNPNYSFDTLETGVPA